MYLITFILALIVLLFLLLILVPLKVTATFDSEEQPNIHVVMSWLNFFLRGFITNSNDSFLLTIYILGIQVYTRDLKKHQKLEKRLKLTDYIHLVKLLDIEDSTLNASYGFEDPSITGMVCGSIDIISQYISFTDFYNNADFSTTIDYFKVKAFTEINIASSIKSYYVSRRTYYKSHKVKG